MSASNGQIFCSGYKYCAQVKKNDFAPGNIAKIFASIGDGQRKPDPSALPRQRLQAGGARTGEPSPPHRCRHRRIPIIPTILRRTVVLRRMSWERFSLGMFTCEQVKSTLSSGNARD